MLEKTFEIEWNGFDWNVKKIQNVINNDSNKIFNTDRSRFFNDFSYYLRPDSARKFDSLILTDTDLKGWWIPT